nr:low molecular weight phosphotyrosine protein phosphatase [Saprospiraceae bacterium]
MRILMVCLGNICRSPLAEGVLVEKIKEKGLDWEVDSAGTSSYHIGERPDPRSIETAELNGIDIRGQRARQVRKKDFVAFDLIYAMDRSNYNHLVALAGDSEGVDKVKLILDEGYPGENREVPDPYWNNRFDEVFNLLSHSCEQIIRKYT